jgi:aspartate carbamoyltransferase catalytic subunit
MTFTRKDILGTQEMNASEIAYLLDATESFLEVSTREVKRKFLRCEVKRLSTSSTSRAHAHGRPFEIAGKRLSADVINISNSSSSAVKGKA